MSHQRVPGIPRTSANPFPGPGRAITPQVQNQGRVSVVLRRPPQTDDELWQAVRTIWGVEIPRQRVCRNHKAPFEAFADAFFARSPVSVWKASRGFGGKSMTLATLGMTEAVLLRSEVVVLGGSSAQSLRVHEVMKEGWDWPLAPVSLLAKQTMYQTHLTHGGGVRALMASQKSVRGPHPQRLRLDEVDEMDYEIFNASLGQPMSTQHVMSQTVISSTHQYPDKTMTKVLERAEENGWPVYEWCYHETAEPNGWLRVSDIVAKQKIVSKQMWDTEYELQEPNFEGRAIDPYWVDRCFDPNLGEFPGEERKYMEFEAPIEDDDSITYVNSADWAKQRDWTIICTYKVNRLNPDVPWKMVAFERLGRMPWPRMVDRLNKRSKRYPGFVVHDSTGLGNVIEDYLECDSTGIEMIGKIRTYLFSEYISGIEGGKLHCPRIKWAYDEHKYVSMDDLFGKGHPPDTVVAGALAWHMRDKLFKRSHLVNLPKSLTKQSAWRST